MKHHGIMIPNQDPASPPELRFRNEFSMNVSSTGMSGLDAPPSRLRYGRGGRKRTPEVESKPTLQSYSSFPGSPALWAESFIWV